MNSFALIYRLIAIAVLQQSAEMIAIRSAWRADGIWSWQTLNVEFSRRSNTKKALGFCFGEKGFQSLLIIQALSAAILLATSSATGLAPLLLGFCLIGTLATAVRWRGTFNGGSDCMTLIVLMASMVASLAPANESIVKACLWWIALQTCLSFFNSGFVKLRQARWRNGTALIGFLKVSNYGVPAFARGIAESPTLCRSISWLVLLFECSFPLALLDHRVAFAYCGLALVFQLANFYLFGLNRFLFAWLAAYPALLYCSR